MNAPAAAAEAPESLGRTEGAAARGGDSRTFPCASCGADLEFHIGHASLSCPYCGHSQEIAFDGDEVAEQDLGALLAGLGRQRGEGSGERAGERAVRCDACGAEVTFVGTLTSTDCAYCGSPIQLAGAHDASEDRLAVDGVLPFGIEREQAEGNLRRWVKSRWFAPGAFRRRGVQGRFAGVYLPFWTYDAMTATRYAGERGEDYTVTVGSGNNRRRETRTRWYPASGAFQRFFDDVLVAATQGEGGLLPLLRRLEPWPLEGCRPFRAQLLAGFQARTYDLPVAEGFEDGRRRMEAAIRDEVRERIGGDRQRIHSVDTRYGALAYKHLLLPVWLLSYRFRQKTYRVAVNAGTGEVQGERPWSWLKIALAVLGALAAVLVVVLLAR